MFLLKSLTSFDIQCNTIVWLAHKTFSSFNKTSTTIWLGQQKICVDWETTSYLRVWENLFTKRRLALNQENMGTYTDYTCLDPKKLFCVMKMYLIDENQVSSFNCIFLRQEKFSWIKTILYSPYSYPYFLDSPFCVGLGKWSPWNISFKYPLRVYSLNLKKWEVGPTTLIERIFYKLLLVGVIILLVYVATQLVEVTILMVMTTIIIVCGKFLLL